jgi:hypothetical protein
LGGATLFAWFWWLIYFAFMVFCIWMCASVAASKGRSPLLYGILGAFFTLITLIVVLILPTRQTA